MRRVSGLWMLAVALACAPPSAAQDERAIAGLVLDRSGAVIPGAAVHLRSAASGLERLRPGTTSCARARRGSARRCFPSRRPTPDRSSWLSSPLRWSRR
jgi:hypothetical protein